jgi:hypothetical protein
MCGSTFLSFDLYSESTVLVVTNYHSCSYHSLYSSAVRGAPTQVPGLTGSLAKLSFDHVDIVLVVVVVIIDVEYVRTVRDLERIAV